ncbi:hypothetical protein PFNF54_02612 [Plasmodium falciparum NF54]|uniref:Uncharacterized protein n=1 Tax=Plasmodium falciparum (isolate NF54) TaxID=5843 RepID=W7JV85_PLAFO|nr:hypothetical protein PFNF54_02612 [Plasmodium falciparum NF54]
MCFFFFFKSSQNKSSQIKFSQIKSSHNHFAHFYIFVKNIKRYCLFFFSLL